MTSSPQTMMQVQSTVADGAVRVGLAEVPVAPPGDHQVLIAVEAAPINPADIMCLLAGAAPANLSFSGSGMGSSISGVLTPAMLSAAQSRAGRALPVGLEGAGRVVAAGTAGQHLINKRVAALCPTLGMFSQYCTVDVANCMELPDDLAARDGADAFCNPLTALAMVETLHQTGHKALVHTAAASNLGQMLVRICQEDGIPLVNIVRRQEQADLLAGIGAEWICNSSAPSFAQDLSQALSATGAMIAFDAIGGGTLASELIAAMEAVAVSRSGTFMPYGTSIEKRVYLYGRLDPGPTVIGKGSYGMVWGVEGWAMPPILDRAGERRTGELMARIARGLTTTFVSQFAHEISLTQFLGSEALLDFTRQATGGKYLLNPQLALA